MKRISLFVAALLVLLSVGLIFLCATESGLRVIQMGVNRFAGDMLSIGQVQGRLLGAGSLGDIRLTSIDANVVVDRLAYSWRPGSLLKGKLDIDKVTAEGVTVVLKDSPESATAGDAVVLPAALPPYAVSLDSLAVSKLRINDSDGEELFLVDMLTASLTGDGQRITINGVDLQSPEIGLVLHGNITPENNWTLELQGNWRLAGFSFQPTGGSISATGPLATPHLELRAQSPADIRIGADLVNLLGKPQWTAKLEAKNVDLSALIIDCPKIDLAALTGDLSGTFEDYRGRVDAQGSWEALDGMHLVSDLTGDFLEIAFQSLRIDYQNSSVEAVGGKISWQDIFSWEGRFLFNNFDPSVIFAELPEKLSAELVSTGDVKDNGVVASFEILSLDGVTHGHNISAAGNISINETEVHTDGLVLRSNDVAGLARIENAFFSWAGEPSWSAKIRLDRFDPSILHAEFPGSINSEFEGKGKLGEKGLEGSLKIKEISGTLRGDELSGGGEITFLQDTLQTTGLVLKCGRSELHVNGQAGESLGLDFSFSSPDIGNLLPETKGRVRLQGTVRGNRNGPLLSAQIEGTGLNYQENSLGRIDAEVNVGLKSDGRLSGSILGDRISVAGFAVDKGAIKVNGTLARQQIAVEGSGTMGTIGFRAAGTYAQDAGVWQGELADFHVEAAGYGVWRQEDKAVMKLGADGAQIERFCLTDQKSVACLGGSVQLGKEVLWTAQGELTSLPLQWLNRLHLVDAPASGEIHANIAASGDSSRVLSAAGEVKLSSAEIMVAAQDSEMVPLRIDQSQLTLKLADGHLQTDLIVRIHDDGRIVLSADVATAGEYSVSPGSLPLRGKLELQEFDLASLGAFTGYAVEPSGSVNNSFTLAGTIGQPKIYGELTIDNGDIYLPYQGISLENVVLSIEAGEESAEVKARAVSGPGQVTVAGTIQYGARGIEGILNIRGNNFLLLNLPEYVIRINPDVALTFTKDGGAMRGSIDIPYGLITPEEMRDSISASEDVVLVSGAKEERAAGWPFSLNVNVRLGEEVRIDGYGLTGRLGGSLRVLTTPDNSIAGKGELDLIDGKFTFYSRSLTIKRGRVLFTGGPIDNPGLDVRAQVEVSDKEARGEGYTVGIDISGLVQDLQYHLFSTPYMDDTEILSYMIAGTSLTNTPQGEEGNMLEAAAMLLGTKGSSEYAGELGRLLFVDDLHLEGSGTKEDMSVVVGKHLTEDLYIGYDLNMFSQLGQFRVRYDLAKGFYVETKSSAEATGTDLFYTFGR